MTDRTAQHTVVEPGSVGRLEFRLLGPVQALDAGRALDIGGAKPRLVLVQLLLSPNRMVSTDALVSALWGDDSPPTARRSLQSHVAKLRLALGGDDGPIRSQSPGYLLAVDEDQIDLWRSESLARQARAALGSDPRQARDLAQRAMREWRGEPLADLAGHDPLVPHVRRLERLRLGLTELEVDAQLASGDTAEAVDRLESLVVVHPEHEPFWARLMTAYYRQGRQRDALRGFERARDALVDGLGVDPSPELRRLELAILGQAAELEAIPPEVCPYKGLASYQVDDADRFCGRDDMIAELVEAVRAASFVVVVGSSGAGKSSILRAGLIKAVGSGTVSGIDHVVLITPGATPLRSIYQVPQSVDLLVVDQFEELFTLTDDEATRGEFVRLLVARVSDGATRVVLSLRADFYGHCTKLAELAPLLARRQVVVGPLTDADLRAVITRPAEQAGLVVERELVDTIVAEATGRPGALPLVSHALVETWHRRQGGRLALADYRDAGSIAAAIARTAENVYGAFGHDQRVQAERLFLRLVEPGDGVEHARRMLPYAQLEGSSIDRNVIDLLVDARLLTAESDGVEVAHEALIEAWPRLRSWIDDDREGIRMHRHLTSAATAWSELGDDEGELYRGARLSAALSWITDAAPDLSDVERRFVEHSVALSEAELRAQQRANRRLRTLVVASLVGAIVAAVGTVVAVRAAGDAGRRRDEAVASQVVAMVREAPDLSSSAKLMLAAAADAVAPTPATQGLLLDSIVADLGLTSRGPLGADLLGDAPVSSNGGVLVGLDDNTLGMVFDASTLEPLLRRGIQPAPSAVVRAGDQLVALTAAVPTGVLEVVDLISGENLGPPGGLTGRPGGVALAPDAARIAVASRAGVDANDVLSVYDVASGEQVSSATVEDAGRVRRVAFSPDGRFVLATVSGVIDRAFAWDASTGKQWFVSTSGSFRGSEITRIAMSPTNTLIALGRASGAVELWERDASVWRLQELPSVHADAITWVDFDATSGHMVSSSRDGQVVVWQTSTAEVAAGPLYFGPALGNVTTYFRADAPTRLVTVDAADVTWEWRLDAGAALVRDVPGVNLGPVTGGHVVFTSTGWTVHDLATGPGAEVTLASDEHAARTGIVSKDGTRVALVHEDGHVELRDVASGGLVIAFAVKAWTLDGVAIALDRHGNRIAFQSRDKRIAIVDDDGTTIESIELARENERLQTLVLNDDGDQLAVSTDGGTAIWYDLDGIPAWEIAERGTGFDAQFVAGDLVAVVGSEGARIIDPRRRRSVEQFAVDAQAVRLAIDPSGRMLATADRSGSIQLWDGDSVSRIGGELRPPTAAELTPIRLTADGHYLIAGGGTTTRLFNTWTDDWPRIACDLAHDEVTLGELEAFARPVEIGVPCS